ncbi:MAG: ATP-grasp domain-containing protein [Methylococcales bacterium]|nr:ATP-grasp domain-containing protein [Methylococcales bacterium]
MKVLIFEFITGGGFAQKDLPESLFNEGLLMLNALIKDFDSLPSIRLTVMLDWRCKELELPDNIEVVWVSNKQSVYDLLPDLIESSDAVWPIAPELDSELQQISLLIECKFKRLLNSSSQAAAICSDKLVTAQVLQKNKQAIVETIQLDFFSNKIVEPWVIKPKDGVGCLDTHFISTQDEFDKIYALIACKENYIIQPYIQGEVLSLSCLFKGGKAWLLCCNRQQVSIKQGKFELEACEVNIKTNDHMGYQLLIEGIAESIEGLWGYVGIDIIQPKEGGSLTLEINPRLTTSYVGINQATGINVAETVISMVDNQPIIRHTHNKQQIINL